MWITIAIIQVEIIRTSTANFQFDTQFDKEKDLGGEYVAKVQGFIHPLRAPSSDDKTLQVRLVVIAAKCKLYISSDDTPSNKVSVIHSPPRNIFRTA